MRFDEDGLRRDLEKLRGSIARSSVMEPYKVFNNNNLDDLVKFCPVNIEELSKIKGFPSNGARVEKYGEKIVSVCRTYRSGNENLKVPSKSNDVVMSIYSTDYETSQRENRVDWSSETPNEINKNTQDSGVLLLIAVIAIAAVLAYNFVLKPIYVGTMNFIGDTSYLITTKIQKEVDVEISEYKDKEFVGVTQFGKPNGYGRLGKSVDNIQLGMFNRGKLNGSGVIINMNEYIFGNFKKNKLEGISAVCIDGELLIGEFKKGEKDGLVAIIHNESNMINIGEYDNDSLISDIAIIDIDSGEVNLMTEDDSYIIVREGSEYGIRKEAFLGLSGITFKVSNGEYVMNYFKLLKAKEDFVLVGNERMLFGDIKGSKMQDVVVIKYKEKNESISQPNFVKNLMTISVGDIKNEGLDGYCIKQDFEDNVLFFGYWKEGNANGKFVIVDEYGRIENRNYRNSEVVGR